MKILGNVKWFDDSKGYGFITGNDGKEYFLHYSQIKMEGHKKLDKDDTVSFEPNSSEKGLQSLNVELIQFKNSSI